MKLKLLFFIAFLCVCASVWCQPASSYLFSSKDVGYVEISDATQLGAKLDSNILQGKMLVGDTGYFNNPGELQKFKSVPLTFNFNFGGKSYTHFLIAANGIVFLGESDSINGAFSTNIQGNSSDNLNNNIFCLLNAYSQEVAALPAGGTKTTSISYKTQTVDGITNLVIQWKNLLYNGNSFAEIKVFDTLSFQIILSSDHTFSIHFDQYKLSENINTVTQMGFKISPSDFHLRGSSESWDQTLPYIFGSSWDEPNGIPLSNTIYPPTGRMYTFTPPPSCTTPLQANRLTITSIKTDSAKFSLGEPIETDAILLVLSPKGNTFTPVNGVIYQTDSLINGSLILLSNLNNPTFSFGKLKGSTEYTLSVFNYNYLCSEGPKYAPAQSIDFTTRLGEPSLVKTGQNTTSIFLKAKADKENNPIILCKARSIPTMAMIEEISADVKVGDTLKTGDTVIYKGIALENHIVNGIGPNTVAQFKAYSYRETPDFTFSTVAAEVWTRTAAILPIRWDVSTFPTFEEQSSVPGFSTLLSNKFNYYRFLFPTNQFGQAVGDGNFEARTNDDYAIETRYHDSTDLILPAVLLESGQHRILFEKAFSAPSRFWGDPVAYRLVPGDSLCVQISLSDTSNSSFKTIHTVNHINYTDNTIDFSKTLVPFSGYNNQIVYFRFVFHSAERVINRLTNFKIERVKDCDYASSVEGVYDSNTANTIFVKWTDVEEDASAWELQYKEAGTQAWSSPLKVEQNPTYIAALNPNTNYLVRVRTLCSPTSVSDWSEASSFIKTGYALPFFSNFDIIDAFVDVLPQGFRNYASTDGTFLKESPSTIADLGAAFNSEAWGRQVWKQNYDIEYPSIYASFSTSAIKLITLPNLEFKADDKSKYMSFSMSVNDAWVPGLSTQLDNDAIRVSVLAIQDPENIQFSDTLITFGKGSSYNLNEMDSIFKKIDLSHLKGNIKIGLLVENTGEEVNAGAYITNLEVDYNCSFPASLTASLISDTNAQISWESSKTSSFLFAYKKASETDYIYSKLSEKTVPLTKLDPSTLYDVKVASLCSNTDTSLFVSTTFSTLAGYVCDTVTNMQVAIQTDNAIISWNGSGVKYKVIWKKTSASQWDTTEVVENKIRLSNLEEGTQYDYSILSQCSSDPSDVSLFTQVHRFRTLYITCHTPTNFKLAKLEWNLVGFSYTITDAQSIELLVGEKDSEIGTNYSFGLHDTIALVGLSPETAYFAKIRANCGGADVSPYTDSITFITPSIPACTPPSQLTSSIDNENKKASLSWSGQGHIAWNLAYKEGNMDWDTLLVEKASYQLSNLKENTPYVWKVQGFCSEYLASRYSSQANFQMTVSLEKLKLDLNDFTVYTQKQHIYIDNPKIRKIDKIEIYNVQGKLLQSHIINSNGNVILPIQLNNAFVIINIHTQEQVYTYKTVIQ